MQQVRSRSSYLVRSLFFDFALEQAIEPDRLRCEKHLGNAMSHRGGRRRTTWENHWNHGQTQNIRVPIVLAPAILEYAKAIDCGMLTPLSLEQYQQIILLAIDQFVEKRKAEFHPNQYSHTGSTTSRRWDELRRFRSAIATSELTFESQRATVRH
ncbi:hypothetical protein [Nostoc sp.]|uniref:hypothetical protein n=1 Tax=Nostoc sp. TaxID=1180 RepID=UPI002FF44C99